MDRGDRNPQRRAGARRCDSWQTCRVPFI